MLGGGIRIAWNTVTQTLCAVHPDDGTYTAIEVNFGRDYYAEAAPGEQGQACAPGGRRLILGPTIAEIVVSFVSPAEPLPSAEPNA
jgi:hypothetical protein